MLLWNPFIFHCKTKEVRLVALMVAMLFGDPLFVEVVVLFLLGDDVVDDELIVLADGVSEDGEDTGLSWVTAAPTLSFNGGRVRIPLCVPLTKDVEVDVVLTPTLSTGG